MKIVTYLINLEGSQDRLNAATAQLNAVHWPFERYAAYDGRGKAITSFEHYDDALTRSRIGRSLMNSEIGCYLSHKGCVEKFLTTDADYLVVLEDDLKIESDFKIKMDRLFECLNQQTTLDWYLINIAAKKKKIAKDIEKFDDFTLWHAYYFPIRGLGLIWSRKGAETFLALEDKITLPVDILFQTWLSQNAKGLGVWPAFVKPAGVDSDILGTVATQGISRKDKENRDGSYTYKRQKRMLGDRFSAFKHLICNK